VTGRQPSLTLEQYRRVRELRELQRRYSDKLVAHELGISVTNLRRIKSQGIKRYDIELAKEANRVR
jgi:AraC-like DNA-binding protein